MALQIINTGISLTTSAASAPGTIPNNSAGAPAKYIRIAATAAAYVRIGTGAQTAVATDMMIQPGDAVIMSTLGCTHIAALQVAAAGIVQVSPVEDM